MRFVSLYAVYSFAYAYMWNIYNRESENLRHTQYNCECYFLSSSLSWSKCNRSKNIFYRNIFCCGQQLKLADTYLIIAMVRAGTKAIFLCKRNLLNADERIDSNGVMSVTVRYVHVHRENAMSVNTNYSFNWILIQAAVIAWIFISLNFLIRILLEFNVCKLLDVGSEFSKFSWTKNLHVNELSRAIR